MENHIKSLDDASLELGCLFDEWDVLPHRAPPALAGDECPPAGGCAAFMKDNGHD